MIANVCKSSCFMHVRQLLTVTVVQTANLHDESKTSRSSVLYTQNIDGIFLTEWLARSHLQLGPISPQMHTWTLAWFTSKFRTCKPSWLFFSGFAHEKPHHSSRFKAQGTGPEASQPRAPFCRPNGGQFSYCLMVQKSQGQPPWDVSKPGFNERRNYPINWLAGFLSINSEGLWSSSVASIRPVLLPKKMFHLSKGNSSKNS